MLTEQTQKIMGYFIEEAKDHLNIIEQGLMNLQQTLEDPELLQELFRAAHSVKGGAAMLGIDSVRDTAHKLEDTFKLLKDNTVEVDDKLESLSIAVFDTLQEALEMLSEEEGLSKEEEKYILQKVNPVFVELEEHLKTLMDKGVTPRKNSQDTSVSRRNLEENDFSDLSWELDSSNVAEEEDFSELFAEDLNLNGKKNMAKNDSSKKNAKGDTQVANNNIDYLDDWFNELENFENNETKKSDAFSDLELKTGPAVGIAELNTLADLFEGETPDLDANWEKEEILNSSDKDGEENSNWSDTDDYDSGDLTDILFGEEEDYSPKQQKREATDLSNLWEEESEENTKNSKERSQPPKSSQPNRASESLDDLFGSFGELEELSQESELPLPDASSKDLVSILEEFEEVETSKENAGTKIKNSEEKEDFKFEDLLGGELEFIPENEESSELEEWFLDTDNQGPEAASIEAQGNSFAELFGDEISKPELDSLASELDREFMEVSPSPSQDEQGGNNETLADLENLLEKDISPPTETKTKQTEQEEDDFDALESLLDEKTSGESSEEDFDALENLLDVSGEEVNLAKKSEKYEEDFDALESLLMDEEDEEDDDDDVAEENLEPKSSGRKSKEVEIDYSDLDKLVENMEADNSRNASTSVVAAVGKRQKTQREQTIKVPAKQLDNLSNLMGELVVNRNSLEQGQERMRQFLDNLLHQVMLLGDGGQQMHDLYERTLLEQTIWKSRLGHRNSSVSDARSSGNDGHSKNSSLSDWELDSFSPFHSLAQTIIEQIVRVRESASDIEFLVEEADQVTRQLRQVTNQLQEGLTKARMVPFAQTTDRLPGAVWRVSRDCGKEAELLVEGKDTLIDKMIQEQLYDPMTHLVNNAVTHGIEMPQDRAAAGKSPKGRITIRAFHQGNQTVISVADDGGGIDPEKVKKKAIEKGLITKSQSQKMSNVDAYDLLFHPGFSTMETANKFAGRGVGMDVVRTKLNEIRGTVTIDSTIGKGTVFTIRLPLTLSISRALCCISDRSWIAFPMDGVEDMIKVSSSEVETGPEGQQYIQWRNSKLPFRHLRELLVYNRQMRRANVYGANTEEDVISVVVLRTASAGSALLAVQVDQVLEQQKEIVIKQLEGPVPKPIGIAGATVLGDGKIVAIADVIELMNLASGKMRREDAIWSTGSENGLSMLIEAEEEEEPTVLIVDDSITVRELLSMTFAKAGYRVEQARDGKDAWEKLRSGLPCDLIFCDIEMPRMDGLELLSRVKKDSTLEKLPMAMLTSRGASKHKQMAYDLGASGYFTKPYLEDHLLDAAGRMLDGEIVGLVPAAAGA